MTLEKSETDFKILRRRFKQNTGAPDAEKYKFYGQHYPQLDEFLFKRYFPDINIRGVFVECGANDGYVGSNCKFFEDTLKWSGWNIEPTPEIFGLLEKKRPNCRNFNLALSDHCGEVTFALTEPVDNNVAYHGAVNRVVDKTLSGGGGQFTVSGTAYRVRQTIQAPCITWKRFVDDNRITFVDLFVLDTEGHEAEIIDGMRDCPVLPSLMCIESGLHENIRGKRAELGYVFDIEHFGNHCYVRRDLLSLFVLRALHGNY
jgi:FkbM family methyltransferase